MKTIALFSLFLLVGIFGQAKSQAPTPLKKKTCNVVLEETQATLTATQANLTAAEDLVDLLLDYIPCIKTQDGLRAIVGAASSDPNNPTEILLCPGTIELTGGEIDITDKAIHVQCLGYSGTCILDGTRDGTAATRIISASFGTNARFDGITFQNGFIDDFGGGGLIYMSSGATCHFINCTFSDGRTVGVEGYGGLLYIVGTASFFGCTFSRGTADLGGAIAIANRGSVSLSNCLFHSNIAPIADGSDNIYLRGSGSLTCNDGVAEPKVTFCGDGTSKKILKFGSDTDTCTTNGNAVAMGTHPCPPE